MSEKMLIAIATIGAIIVLECIERMIRMRRRLNKVLAEQQTRPPPPAEDWCADDIRRLGWSVAVHNDYTQNGEEYTFWLFTKGGAAIKGEGRTDAEALNQVREKLDPAYDPVLPS